MGSCVLPETRALIETELAPLHLRNYSLKCAISHVVQIQALCEDEPERQLNTSRRKAGSARSPAFVSVSENMKVCM